MSNCVDFEPMWRRQAELAHQRAVAAQLEPPIVEKGPARLSIAAKPLKTHCHRGHNRLEPGAIMGEYVCRKCDAIRRESMKLARKAKKEKRCLIP